MQLKLNKDVEYIMGHKFRREELDIHFHEYVKERLRIERENNNTTYRQNYVSMNNKEVQDRLCYVEQFIEVVRYNKF